VKLSILAAAAAVSLAGTLSSFAADITGAGGNISDQYRGIDRGVYPSSRTFSVGITASF
jgi:hypothetical protein